MEEKKRRKEKEGGREGEDDIQKLLSLHTFTVFTDCILERSFRGAIAAAEERLAVEIHRVIRGGQRREFCGGAIHRRG